MILTTGNGKMVKALNRTVRNDICFVYRNQASEDVGFKPNEEIRIVEITPDGRYIISCDDIKKEITKIQAKLIMVYE